MGERKYIGARYVPLILGPWDNTIAYEPLSQVTYDGDTYTSIMYVPEGVDIFDSGYWVCTSSYNSRWYLFKSEMEAIIAKLQEDWETYQTSLNAEWASYQEDLNAQWASYQEGLNAEWESYQEILNSEWAAFQEAYEAEWTEYQETLNAAWEEYQSALTAEWESWQITAQAAWEAYKEGLNSEWEAYQTELNAAWEEYQTTMNSAWSTFQTDFEAEWEQFQSDYATEWNEYKETVDSALSTYYSEYTTYISAFEELWATYKSEVQAALDAFAADWETYQTSISETLASYVSTYESYISAFETSWSEYQTTIEEILASYVSTYESYISAFETSWSEYQTTIEETLASYVSTYESYISAFETSWSEYQDTITATLSEYNSNLSEYRLLNQSINEFFIGDLNTIYKDDNTRITIGLGTYGDYIYTIYNTVANGHVYYYQIIDSEGNVIYSSDTITTITIIAFCSNPYDEEYPFVYLIYNSSYGYALIRESVQTDYTLNAFESLDSAFSVITTIFDTNSNFIMRISHMCISPVTGNIYAISRSLPNKIYQLETNTVYTDDETEEYVPYFIIDNNMTNTFSRMDYYKGTAITMYYNSTYTANEILLVLSCSFDNTVCITLINANNGAILGKMYPNRYSTKNSLGFMSICYNPNDDCVYLGTSHGGRIVSINNFSNIVYYWLYKNYYTKSYWNDSRQLVYSPYNFTYETYYDYNTLIVTRLPMPKYIYSNEYIEKNILINLKPQFMIGDKIVQGFVYEDSIVISTNTINVISTTEAYMNYLYMTYTFSYDYNYFYLSYLNYVQYDIITNNYENTEVSYEEDTITYSEACYAINLFIPSESNSLNLTPAGIWTNNGFLLNDGTEPIIATTFKI